MNLWQLQRQELKILQMLNKPTPDLEGVTKQIDQVLAEPNDPRWDGAGMLLAELSHGYANQGRYTEAIAKMERAMQVGLRSTPDARVDIAGFLLHQGKLDEAEALFKAVQLETPDDVWLYNGAGMAYQFVDHHQEALIWLTQGLELAIKEGHQEMIHQFSELRQESMNKLGESVYDLVKEVNPLVSTPQINTASAGNHPENHNGMIYGLAWFPRQELIKALQAIPDWRSVPEKRSYKAHCLSVENVLRLIKAQGGVGVPVPIRFDEYATWCKAPGKDPADNTTVSEYTASKLQHRAPLVWPPHRNEHCWCKSGKKYKKCCGSA